MLAHSDVNGSEVNVTTRMHSVNSRRSFQVAISLALLGLALVAPTACDQPKVRCAATSGEAIARYQIVGKPTGSCDGITLPGMVDAKGKPAWDSTTYEIGVETYHPSPADTNAYNEVNSVALKAEWIGTRIADARDNASVDPKLASQAAALANYPYGTGAAPAPPPDGATSNNYSNFPFAWGKFDSVYPDGNNICTISSMTVSDLTYPDIPAHSAKDPNNPGSTVSVDDQPAIAVKYEWKNVKVIVSADSIGTQTFADLSVTENKCTINYQVSILFPKVSCGIPDPSDPTGKKQIGDPTACDPNPNAKNNFGSGIGQGIPTSCENISSDPDPANADFECMPIKMAP